MLSKSQRLLRSSAQTTGNASLPPKAPVLAIIDAVKSEEKEDGEDEVGEKLQKESVSEDTNMADAKQSPQSTPEKSPKKSRPTDSDFDGLSPPKMQKMDSEFVEAKLNKIKDLETNVNCQSQNEENKPISSESGSFPVAQHEGFLGTQAKPQTLKDIIRMTIEQYTENHGGENSFNFKLKPCHTDENQNAQAQRLLEANTNADGYTAGTKIEVPLSELVKQTLPPQNTNQESIPGQSIEKTPNDLAKENQHTVLVDPDSQDAESSDSHYSLLDPKKLAHRMATMNQMLVAQLSSQESSIDSFSESQDETDGEEQSQGNMVKENLPPPVTCAQMQNTNSCTTGGASGVHELTGPHNDALSYKIVRVEDNGSGPEVIEVHRVPASPVTQQKAEHASLQANQALDLSPVTTSVEPPKPKLDQNTFAVPVTPSNPVRFQIKPVSQPLYSSTPISRPAGPGTLGYNGTPYPSIPDRFMLPYVQQGGNTSLTAMPKYSTAGPVGSSFPPPRHSLLNLPRLYHPPLYHSPMTDTSGLSLNSSGSEQNSSSGGSNMTGSSAAGSASDSSAIPTPPHTPYNTPNNEGASMGYATPSQLNSALFQKLKEDFSGGDMDIGRLAHNAKERQRRARIKMACEKLREFVPGADTKTDKATMFEITVSYVAFLKQFVGDQYDREFLARLSTVPF